MNDSYAGYRDWKGWNAETFGAVDRASRRYFEAELAAEGIQSLGGLRVLEIGFGNGAFAAWARQSGAEYVGVEAIPELVAAARQAGIDAYQYSDDLDLAHVSTESMGLIVAFDVFEHLALPDLHKMLSRCRDLLSPGGVLLARVPSGDSPFGRATQYGDLTHRLVLGSSAVRQIALNAGLEVKSVRSLAFPICGVGLVSGMRRLLVSAARHACHRFISLVLMGGGSPVLTPNMVFSFRRPLQK
jgi:2-polyprenyl-3-methyl-5-hydroxy-6-metoxy-1,4-benzoquinol methylase